MNRKFTIEAGPVGPDWRPSLSDEKCYAQLIIDGQRAGAFDFGPTPEAARDNLIAKLLEDAQEVIVLADASFSGANMNIRHIQKKAKAFLAKLENRHE